MGTRYGWDDDVRHYLSQTMPGPQADDMVAALKREHAQDLTEQARGRAHEAAVAKLRSIYSGQIPDSVAREIADAVLDAIQTSEE